MTETNRDGIKHGTRYAYNTHGCRCDECKAASAAYMRDYYARNKRGEVNNTTEIPHGTVNGYSYRGCRCDACKKAVSDYQKEYRARKKADSQELERLRAEVDYLRRQARKQEVLGFTD